MKLYLIRHAIAADPTPEMTDEARPLTSEGVKKFRQTVAGLLKLKPRIDMIFSSPLVRARQTAAILADKFETTGEHAVLEIQTSLAPPARLDAFLSHLAKLEPDVSGVAAVGHEPAMSEWIGKICFDSPGRCHMKKGAIAAIDLDVASGKGELLFLLEPGFLRRI
ncbi:MAG TPA: phosphohistidine phosphatase SixA [Phycisphaerae bacterium]|nr:phosphohistidine phosphatase SixA [Phycisphaerae bacterium]